jgi:hypothetical protein
LTAPTREHRMGGSASRILNFERPLIRGFGASGNRDLRLHRHSSTVERLRAIPLTQVGQVVRASNGPVVKFLGVTRLVRGIPDYALLGRGRFGEDVRAPMTGVISVNGTHSPSIESAVGDLRCQFLVRDLDGSYRDDVHEVESLAPASHGLMVGVPFGSAALRAEVPFRNSRYEYVIFRGSARLTRASEVLVRFRFEVAPR